MKEGGILYVHPIFVLYSSYIKPILNLRNTQYLSGLTDSSFFERVWRVFSFRMARGSEICSWWYGYCGEKAGSGLHCGGEMNC